jgi:hypothetical protein
VAQVDEQEQTASPDPDPVSAETTQVTGPAAGPERDHRADGVREALTSRGAGWAVAAAMTGAVVGLSVAMATSSAPTVVIQPEGMLRGIPAGGARIAVPGGGVQAQSPVRLRLRAPARLRAQVPAGLPLQSPARLRLQVPVRAPRRLQVVAPAAGTLIPAPRAVPGARLPTATLPPGALVPGAPAQRVLAPGAALRLRIRPGQVRIRVRVPARALQVLPASRPGALRAVPSGPLPAQILPPGAVAPARLRIVFQKGVPVPARLVLPASLPGRARLRIQIPARAQLTPALPAPPNW